MPSYPTDLSAEEKELAQARLQEMAEEFSADGTLRTPVWREVFQRSHRDEGYQLVAVLGSQSFRSRSGQNLAVASATS